MKVKQYSIKVFELTIDTEDSFLAFLEKNRIMLKSYLVVVKGNMTLRIRRYLDHHDIAYTTNLNFNKRSEQEHLLRQSDLRIVEDIVRSGQELDVNSDLLVLNRVNSGATIRVDGNLIVTDVVDGMIECHGEFMLIKTSPKALIVFHGLEIEGALLQDRFHKIRFNGEEVKVSPIEKEPRWA